MENYKSVYRVDEEDKTFSKIGVADYMTSNSIKLTTEADVYEAIRLHLKRNHKCACG